MTCPSSDSSHSSVRCASARQQEFPKVTTDAAKVMQGGDTLQSLFAGFLHRLSQLLHLFTKVLQLRSDVVRLFADFRGCLIDSLRDPVNRFRNLIDVFREDNKTGKSRTRKQIYFVCAAVRRLLARLRVDPVDLFRNGVDVLRKCGEAPKGLASQQICLRGHAGRSVVTPLSRLNERLDFALRAHAASLQLGESPHYINHDGRVEVLELDRSVPVDLTRAGVLKDGTADGSCCQESVRRSSRAIELANAGRDREMTALAQGVDYDGTFVA